MVFQLNEVMKALENREFKVYFQPQYDAISNRIHGAEALSRWIRDDGTMIMPKDFISFMESEGIILDLDWYVLDEVCRFVKGQKESGNRIVPISVNFSRLHLREEDCLERINAIVDFYEVDHAFVVIEITESIFTEDSETVSTFCDRLRENGYKVAIDDFGSGYSSLCFLKDVNVDILKLDKALLNGNFENDKERMILETVILLANRLKLCTVAEGVETKEQLGFLQTCDCMEIQGFVMAKPMTMDEFRVLCAQEHIAPEIDILAIQNRNSAMELLMEAVFDKHPLVIFANLTRNSYYMMAYDHFTTKKCSGAGKFDELIEGGAQTMHPSDRERFKEIFRRESQIRAYENGEKRLRLVTRQQGDDGVYRRVETVNYFVKNPASDDLLVITLCNTME